MGLRDIDERALAATGRLVAATRPDQLGLPTPCAGWDVRALLDHLVGGNHMFAAAAAGEQVDWSARDRDHLGDDPTGAYDRSAAAAIAAFAARDLDADLVELPIGLVPARHAVAVHFVDVLTHGWDLATATGQDATLDPDLATAALDIVAGYPAELWGTPRYFAHKVAVPDDAPPHVRLVAVLGRQPE